MGTDAGEPDGTDGLEPIRRRTSYVPPPRPHAPETEPRTAQAGAAEPEPPDVGPEHPVSPAKTRSDDVPATGPTATAVVHDDDELADALQNEVSLLTASLPIIRPESLFTPVAPTPPIYEPTTDEERDIAQQAEHGDTLAAIERLEALIAGRGPAAGGETASNVREVAEPEAFADETPKEEPHAPGAPVAIVSESDPGPATAEMLLPADEDLDTDVSDDADDVETEVADLAPIATPRVRTASVLTVGRPRSMPVFSIEQSGMEPTPYEYRIGRASRLFWLWFATGASVLVIGLGAVLVAAGLNIVQVVVAAVLGIALSFIPLGLGALTGAWTGQPTVVVSRATFGVVGNVVPATLILIVRVFWSAALLWLLAVTVSDTAAAAGWTSDRALVLWSVLGVGAGICIVVAVFGYALVAAVQAVATVATAVLALAIIVVAWPREGWDGVVSAPFGEWILVVEGAVLVFSVLGLAWASAGGDLARYQRARSAGTATALWSGFGASLPMLVLVVFGALVVLARPAVGNGFQADPVKLLVDSTPTWFAFFVVAAIAVGLLSALVISLYSGGFAVQAVGIRLPRGVSVAALGVVTAAAAAGLASGVPDVRTLLLAYPTTLAVPVAAWAGIFLGDFLLRRRRIATDSLLRRGAVYPDWRWWNVAGLVVITVVGLGFMRAGATGLRWEGYLFALLGVDPHGTLAGSDLGVLIALVLGAGLGLLAGRQAVARQEAASR